MLPCPFELKSSNSGRKAMNAENHFPWTLPLSAECSACYFPIVLSDSPLWIHCKPDIRMALVARAEGGEEIAPKKPAAFCLILTDRRRIVRIYLCRFIRY
uniref:Uncharacterized protein n=1 Tax=Opuntia streptacantha TaxID=393608 RepID=A0A7C8ZLY7_OPUST